MPPPVIDSAVAAVERQRAKQQKFHEYRASQAEANAFAERDRLNRMPESRESLEQSIRTAELLAEWHQQQAEHYAKQIVKPKAKPKPKAKRKPRTIVANVEATDPPVLTSVDATKPEPELEPEAVAEPEPVAEDDPFA